MGKIGFVGAALLCASVGAHAAYDIVIAQDGPDVVLQGSGTLNTSGMTFVLQSNGCGPGVVGPTTLCLGTGTTGLFAASALTPGLTGLTGGQVSIATDGRSSGPYVIIDNTNLFLPSGYLSGTQINNSSRFVSNTLANMELTVGTTRTLTLVSGDTINFRVLASLPPVAPVVPTVTSVPTLSEYAPLALSGLIALAFVAVRRKRG